MGLRISEIILDQFSGDPISPPQGCIWYRNNIGNGRLKTSISGSTDGIVLLGDLDTLAALNSTVGDATLIDTADPRLSDARNPTAHNHVAADITDFDTEVSNNADVAANTVKVTNANHSGEMDGDGVLSANKVIITNKTLVTAASGDLILIADATDSFNLKKIDAADLLGGGGDNLGNHTATQDLNLDSNKILGAEKLNSEDGTKLLPTYSFTDDTDTGMYREPSGDLAFTNSGKCILEIAPNGHVFISPTDVPTYETLVTTDNSIPNKKYVDDHNWLASDITDFDTEVSNNADVAANTTKTTNVTTNLSIGTKTATTVDVNSSDGTNATLPQFTNTEAGLVPSSGGGTTNFLRADGTFAAPTVGSVTQHDRQQIFSATIDSTTSDIYSDVAGMALTTKNLGGTGNYMVTFNADVTTTVRGNHNHYFIINVNGSDITNSEKRFSVGRDATGNHTNFSMTWMVTGVASGQIIKIRFKESAGATLSVDQRNLTIDGILDSNVI